MQNEDLDTLKSQAKVLKDRLEAIKKDYRTKFSADSGERAVELENEQTLQEIERVTEEELNALNKKIAALTFSE